MGNFRRSSKYVIGRSKPDGRCRKHPKHQQSPGVCSLCLSEKLSQLSTSSSRCTTTTTGSSSSSSSASTYYSSSSSASASSCSSPMHYRYRFNTSEGKGSLFLLLSSKHGLKKSRSLAFVPTRMRGNKEGDDHHEKKKKGGFLSSLLRSRRRMDDRLVHSRSTLREVIAS